MMRALFGLLTALLSIACVLLAAQCYRRKKHGLALIFALNAFTNLVNSIHAAYNVLF